MRFLKQLGPLPKVYKKVIKEEKVMSVAALREEGWVVNQNEKEKEPEESLI